MMACGLAIGAAAQTPQQQTPPQQTPDKPKPELQQRDRPKAAPTGKQEEPPEEDKSLTKEEFSFNPLEAEKNLKIGNYYFKVGKYRSAQGRFEDATKWNDGYAEAWLRLGEADEKLKDPKKAVEAYNKYLELSPDAKNAAEIRKKIEKIK